MPGIAGAAAARISRSTWSAISRSSCAAAIYGVVREAVIAAAAHGADDPAVPRQLAQHADHRHLHPAVDPGLDHLPCRARRDDQHHDARRPGARGRHPGRRCHRHHREHQLPSRARRGRRGGDSQRCARDRGAGASSRRWRSASCSCRCSCSSASRASCSCRWPRRWSSPCWPRTCCRVHWCRRWPSTGSAKHDPHAHEQGHRAIRAAAAWLRARVCRACAIAIAACSSARCTRGRALRPAVPGRHGG